MGDTGGGGVAGRGDKWGEAGWMWVLRGAKHLALSATSMLRFGMKGGGCGDALTFFVVWVESMPENIPANMSEYMPERMSEDKKTRKIVRKYVQKTRKFGRRYVS